MSEERPPYMYEADGDAFVPTRSAHGYWMPNTLSGSAAASLLGHVLQRDHLPEGWVPVRLSIDMVRMPPAAPLRVDAKVLHESGRLKLVEARLMAGDTLVTLALCQIARRTTQPANPVWQSAPWPAPHPDTLPGMRHWGRWDLRAIAPEHPRFQRETPAGGDRAHSNAAVLGHLAHADARQAWLRTQQTIVQGEPLTPFLHLVTTADFASPLTHSSAFGIDFVNTDFTIHLHRLPRGEWLGYELAGHSSADGVAVGEAAIHDVDGPLGMIVVSAMANTRRK